MVAYVIVFFSFFILLIIIKKIIVTILIYFGKKDVLISTVNWISVFVSISIICFSAYMWIESTLKNTKFDISKFKIEKCVLLKSPDFTDTSKTYDVYYFYYNFEIKNNDEDLKKFSLYNQMILDNFNNMGGVKTIHPYTTLYGPDNKEKKFDEINLFKKGEVLKGYGYIELSDESHESLKWFTDNIPFKTEIKFKISGGNAKDKFKSQEIIHNIDLSKFKENILDLYKDSNKITLEYYHKDKYSPKQLKKNIWSEKMKQNGKKETDGIHPEEILYYLYNKRPTNSIFFKMQ
jgi:hypothetical protein